ncbi:hypothetical protein [Pontibacter sp. SGAir0037]|uniref:hypothetical protein n=1 Tax=Pontibacter sp. SGAir0037 TaxID=2571030 RepID=UPI0010CD3EF3|nr:hypothetical protein [Pontibacter sp. SGAir0037]QCR21510.1 hypothetical protein C1N53_03540 [Pontibacter sp. SGAir0037]
MAFILIRLIAVALIIFPLLSGVFVFATDAILSFSQLQSLSFIYIVWGFSLFYFSWSFLLFTLIPYSFMYVLIPMKELGFFYKFMLFYIMLVIMGLIVPEASVAGAFNVNPYPRALVLYFLLTISICPLCNLFLNKKAHFQEAHDIDS